VSVMLVSRTTRKSLSGSAMLSSRSSSLLYSVGVRPRHTPRRASSSRAPRAECRRGGMQDAPLSLHSYAMGDKFGPACLWRVPRSSASNVGQTTACPGLAGLCVARVGSVCVDIPSDSSFSFVSTPSQAENELVIELSEFFGPALRFLVSIGQVRVRLR